jgi:hypothetical protein
MPKQVRQQRKVNILENLIFINKLEFFYFIIEEFPLNIL